MKEGQYHVTEGPADKPGWARGAARHHVILSSRLSQGSVGSWNTRLFALLSRPGSTTWPKQSLLLVNIAQLTWKLWADWLRSLCLLVGETLDNWHPRYLPHGWCWTAFISQFERRIAPPWPGSTNHGLERPGGTLGFKTLVSRCLLAWNFYVSPTLTCMIRQWPPTVSAYDWLYLNQNQVWPDFLTHS